MSVQFPCPPGEQLSISPCSCRSLLTLAPCTLNTAEHRVHPPTATPGPQQLWISWKFRMLRILSLPVQPSEKSGCHWWSMVNKDSTGSSLIWALPIPLLSAKHMTVFKFLPFNLMKNLFCYKRHEGNSLVLCSSAMGQESICLELQFYH